MRQRALAGDQTLLRQMNRTAIIRAVWETPGVSRSEVAQRVGLTKSTVSLLTGELIHEGWLADGESSIASTPGRPSIPLRINAERFALLGVEVGVHELNAVSIDPNGTVLREEHVHGDFRNLRVALEQVSILAHRLDSLAHREGRDVVGVGIGVPGPVNTASQVLAVAPNLGWSNIPLERLLHEHLSPSLGARVFVDNDANLSAMSEYLFGPNRHCSDLLYIYIAHGIGGGLMLNHAIYRGRHGFAGEIGHITMNPNGPKCSCGNHGCAETLFSVHAIERDVFEATNERLSLEQTRQRLLYGDRDVTRVLHRAATHLGVFVSNLVNALDPEVVVIGGPIMELGEALLEPARREMQRRLFGKTHRTVELRRSVFDGNECAIGAAGFAWHNLLETAGKD
jgi:predicted NBD/HSP70 family sugar kinase